MSRTLTILHLSDLHARLKSDWDSSKVIQKLTDDIRLMQGDHGLYPDLIFFTGDASFGAANGESMTDQYQIVKSFLDSVRKAFNPEIPIRDVYMVPGNHDIDRNEISPAELQWLRDPKRTVADILSVMQDGKRQWRNWIDKFSSYRSFLRTYGFTHLQPDYTHLIWGDVREIAGRRIGIAGFNSAWSCADDNDKGKLWCGIQWQCAELKKRNGPVEFSISLIHHPSNWFTGGEDPSARRLLSQEFAMTLHGHEHLHWVDPTNNGNLILSAGACYESSWMRNGYSFIQINPKTQSGNVWLREWDSVGAGWVAANIADKTHNGVYALENLRWIKSKDEKNKNGKITLTKPPSSNPTAHMSPIEHYTRRYCEHVIEQHDVLDLFGCDIPRELQRHQLSVAYVSLNLTTIELVKNKSKTQNEKAEPLKQASLKSISAKNDLETPTRSETESAISESSIAFDTVLDRVCNENERLMIFGPAGAGKSTLLRWCAINTAKNILEGPPILLRSPARSSDEEFQQEWSEFLDTKKLFSHNSWRWKIPVLIRLRDCPNGKLPAAQDLLQLIAKHLPSAPQDWTTGLFDSGRACILLDGVDEVHKDQRPQLAEEISELVTTFPKCMYVITTRPGAVESGWLKRLKFSEAHVEPMSRGDREEFIDKWYKSAALELKARPRIGEDLTQTAIQLKNELLDQPELAIVASNPLLCAMICALYRDRQEKLPESPAELCEALIQTLLHRRERETPGLTGGHFSKVWSALQYPQKKGILSELAWEMVKDNKSIIDKNHATTIVGRVLKTTPGRKKEEAVDVFQALVERSGLLRPSDRDSVDFLHNTLKEFLAGEYIVSHRSKIVLSDKAEDPAWQPVILFALALAPESFSSKLVGSILLSIEEEHRKKARSTKNEMSRLYLKHFFLVRCRNSAKRLSPKLSAKIDPIAGRLFPPLHMEHAESLALIGPRILSYGSSRLMNASWWKQLDARSAARCLRLIRMVGGPKAISSLRCIEKLTSHSSQLNGEWLVACKELDPKYLHWPFRSGVVHVSNNRVSDISPICKIAILDTLWINNTRVSDISILASTKGLRSLNISETKVNKLDGISAIKTLESLNISNTTVSDLSPIRNLNKLKYLYAYQSLVEDIDPLQSLTMLQSLSLGGSKINNLRAIKNLRSLVELSIWYTSVTNISPLSKLHNLQNLDFNGCRITDLSPIAHIVALRKITMDGCSIENIDPIRKLKNIQHLDLDNTLVSNIDGIKKLHALKQLNLAKTKIVNLGALRELEQLIVLNISKTALSEISPLSKLKRLSRLSLSDTAVQDLSPLKDLEFLSRIDIRNTPCTDTSGLEKIRSLKSIVASSNMFSAGYLQSLKKRQGLQVMIFDN